MIRVGDLQKNAAIDYSMNDLYHNKALHPVADLGNNCYYQSKILAPILGGRRGLDSQYYSPVTLDEPTDTYSTAKVTVLVLRSR